jgi:tetratricopeptide (TPR) repeat protein
LEELGSSQINSNNVHRYFQLGYAFRDINELQKAIYYFKLIADCENASINYRYISAVFAAKYFLVLNNTNADIEMYLQKAINLNQNRKEAYYYLAIYERKRSALLKVKSILEKANELSFSNEDSVIVEESIYLWKIKYELAFVYFLLHQYKESADIILQMKNEGHLPEVELGLLDSLWKKMIP